jgi:DNA-binding protein H-NS
VSGFAREHAEANSLLWWGKARQLKAQNRRASVEHQPTTFTGADRAGLPLLDQAGKSGASRGRESASACCLDAKDYGIEYASLFCLLSACTISPYTRSISLWRLRELMKAARLKNLSIDALLDLRRSVDDAISTAGKTLQSQLARLGLGTARRQRSTKGRKVAPKYRGPKGETWAGRGARPRWLTALLRRGHKIEEFSVDKEVRTKARKKVRKKRKR